MTINLLAMHFGELSCPRIGVIDDDGDDENATKLTREETITKNGGQWQGGENAVETEGRMQTHNQIWVVRAREGKCLKCLSAAWTMMGINGTRPNNTPTTSQSTKATEKWWWLEERRRGQ
jgi:hypothetical protein